MRYEWLSRVVQTKHVSFTKKCAKMPRFFAAVSALQLRYTGNAHQMQITWREKKK